MSGHLQLQDAMDDEEDYDYEGTDSPYDVVDWSYIEYIDGCELDAFPDLQGPRGDGSNSDSLYIAGRGGWGNISHSRDHHRQRQQIQHLQRRSTTAIPRNGNYCGEPVTEHTINYLSARQFGRGGAGNIAASRRKNRFRENNNNIPDNYCYNDTHTATTLDEHGHTQRLFPTNELGLAEKGRDWLVRMSKTAGSRLRRTSLPSSSVMAGSS